MFDMFVYYGHRKSVLNCFIGKNTIFAPLSARMFALRMDRRTVDYDPNPRSLDGFGNIRENFIFANSNKIHICDVKNS